MTPQNRFFCALAFFAFSWLVVIFLYLSKVLPVVKQRRGRRSLVEAGLQLNFSNHIKEYRRAAHERQNRSMYAIYYAINVFTVFSAASVLIAMLIVITSL